MIPQQSIDFIVQQETGGRSYYDKIACHPVWPGGMSGLTIGVGYDLGQNSAARFQADWGTVLDAAIFKELATSIGLRGGSPDQDAHLKELVRQLHGITISWDVASQVFASVSVPDYTQRTLAAFPGLEKLHGLCVGAMVSLVYNRGTSLVGDSRVEMRKIHDLLQAGQPRGVPDQIRSMKRLWPTVPGLQKRRDAEAQMFQDGLDQMAPVA